MNDREIGLIPVCERTEVIAEVPLTNLIQEFIQTRVGIKPKSAKYWAASLRLLDDFTYGRLPDQKLYAEFYKYLRSNYSPHYQTGVVRRCWALFEYGHIKGIFKERWWRLFPMPKPKTLAEKQIITHEDFLLVERKARTTIYYGPLVTMWFTGMSCGDACTLKWEDVDLEQLAIFVRRRKTDSLQIIPILAGSLMHESLTKAHRMRDGDYVWPAAAEKYLRSQEQVSTGINEVVRSVCPGKTSKHMRNTMASRAANAGVNESMAMQIGGWKDPKIFREYILKDMSGLREAYAKMMAWQPSDKQRIS